MRPGARFLGVFALIILVPGGLLAALGVRALVQERRAAGAELEKFQVGRGGFEIWRMDGWQ